MLFAVEQGPDPGSIDLSDAIKPSGLTTVDWIVAAAILGGGLVLSLAVRRLVHRVFRRLSGAPHTESLVGRLFQAIIGLVALAYALGAIGVRITPLLGALGIGGLAIALALQPALLNLFSGMILHAQRPMRLGDEIVTGDVRGTVVDIASRAVVVRTYAGQIVYIPNSVVLDREIVNLVREGSQRTTINVGVAYDTDLRRAKRILEDAISQTVGVLDAPTPRVFATEFADSSINFEVDYWHAPEQASLRLVRSEAIQNIHVALAEAGVTIPFPQRTLWLADHTQPSAGEPDVH